MLGETMAFGRWRQVRSLIGLVLLTWAMLSTQPLPSGDRRSVLLVLVVVAALSWVAMTLRFGGPRTWLVASVICGAVGVALVVISDRGFAIIYPAVVCFVAGWTFGLVVSIGLTSTLVIALLSAQTATGTPFGAAVGSAVSLLVGLLVGVVRRQREQQSQQRELLRVETEHAREERARAAALAERARLAREIHDVLAHSLSALAVQLETAAALLEHGRTGQAAEVVDQAGRIAREGLTETRRAVTALRGDPLPLPELVTALAEAHRRDVDAPAEVRVSGTPRALSPEAGHALYRAAQEALTNVHKHAPGARVRVELAYRSDGVRLTVTDDGGPGAGTRPPGAGLPPGYGLTGLRERAELAGGSVETGPTGTGWRVDVRMPG